MFHSQIIGAKCANLDLFFFRKNVLRYLLVKNGAADRDVNIIEGVMGYCDGIGLSTTKASTYEVAQVTKSPVILVINAKGASLSVPATIQGFLTLYPNNNICGVVLNQYSSMSYPTLARVIQERFSRQIRPLGFLPKMPDCALENRHLGLVTAAEVEKLREKLQIMAWQAEKSLDLDSLLALAEYAPTVTYTPVALPRYNETIRIAVARDSAFCFYYEDSLESVDGHGR